MNFLPKIYKHFFLHIIQSEETSVNWIEILQFKSQKVTIFTSTLKNS